MGVGVRVDGLMVATVAVVAVAGLIWWKRKAIGAAVDPTNSDNLINQGFEGLARVVKPDYESGDVFCWLLGGCEE